MPEIDPHRTHTDEQEDDHVMDGHAIDGHAMDDNPYATTSDYYHGGFEPDVDFRSDYQREQYHPTFD